jgi:two-component system KDP operon response regulator KdpE
MSSPARNRPLVLTVEDESRIARYLRSSLQMAGYDVLVAADGVQALEQVKSNNFDLILLDLGLPHLDGFGVLARIRETSEVPIVVVTARDSEDDKVKALMAGADDYITKPFGTRELQARLVAVLRRTHSYESATEKKEPVYINGELRIDVQTRRVFIADQPVHLTPTEYRLLLMFCENLNRVLTHDYLLANVWGTEYSQDVHILRATIWRLRQKIEHDPSLPVYILNEPGVGYRMPPTNQ